MGTSTRLIQVVYIASVILSCNAFFACTSGECVIDCDIENCDIIVCTNYASSCIIMCSDEECEESQFYLAARNYNTVYCSGITACNEVNIQCGSPDQPPIGYSEYDFIGRYDSKLKCNFVTKPQPFIAPNPTPKPTLKPTLKPTPMYDTLSYHPTTESPTVSPTYYTPTVETDKQINQDLSVIKYPQTDTGTDSNKSVLGMEVFIVLGSIGLFCVLFTICFCVCISVDYHEKMDIWRENQQRVSRHISLDSSNPSNDAAHHKIELVPVPSNSIFTGDPATSYVTSEKQSSKNSSLHNGNMDTLQVNTASSSGDKPTMTNTSNTSNSNSSESTKIASAEVLSGDMPSYSEIPIQSQRSGYIESEVVFAESKRSVMETTGVYNEPSESECNLSVKRLSISNTLPLVFDAIDTGDTHSISHTFNSMVMNEENGTVIRKETGDMMGMVQWCKGDGNGSCAHGCDICDFGRLLMDKQLQSEDLNTEYYD